MSIGGFLFKKKKKLNYVFLERGLGCVQAMVVVFGSTEIRNTAGNKREAAKSRMGVSDCNSWLISKYMDRYKTTDCCCSFVVSVSNEVFQLKAGFQVDKGNYLVEKVKTKMINSNENHHVLLIF